MAEKNLVQPASVFFYFALLTYELFYFAQRNLFC